MRHQRTLALLTLLAQLGSLVGAVPAFASPSPDAFVDGPVPPWGWQRFDAQYYAPQGRIYFLGAGTGPCGSCSSTARTPRPSTR